MTQDQALSLIKSHISDNYGTARTFAKKFNVSAAFVSAVLNGKKSPPQWMLAEVGIKKGETIKIQIYEQGDN